MAGQNNRKHKHTSFCRTDQTLTNAHPRHVVTSLQGHGDNGLGGASFESANPLPQERARKHNAPAQRIWSSVAPRPRSPPLSGQCRNCSHGADSTCKRACRRPGACRSGPFDELGSCDQARPRLCHPYQVPHYHGGLHGRAWQWVNVGRVQYLARP